MVKTISKNNNGDKITKILSIVSSKISPDMSAVKDADIIVDKINALLKKSKINAVCVKGGSIAKGTFLKDDYDIDLFIRYNPSYVDKDISSITEPIIASLCKSLKIKFERIHGSRDYYQFATIKESKKTKESKNTKTNKIGKEFKELSFEIIPVILVHASNHYDANNSTDLSPEHVNWVLNHTRKNPKLTDDIRLAKQFCKANNIYGAESYINGFSGHIIDILVIHYGSFLNLIRHFSKYDSNKLDSPVIIDTEKHLINPLKQLNRNKITPLIIIDPIQPERNSAAAVSKIQLIKFIESCKSFLNNPNEAYFEIQKFDINNEIKKSIDAITKNSKLKISKTDIATTIIDVKTLDGSKDIVGTKVLKFYETTLEQMKLSDFKILGSSWNFDYEKKSAIIYIITDKNMSSNIVQNGPPESAVLDYKKFIDKHTKLKHKLEYGDGRIKVIIKRKFTDSLKFIKDLYSKDFMQNRVKDIKISSK